MPDELDRAVRRAVVDHGNVIYPAFQQAGETAPDRLTGVVVDYDCAEPLARCRSSRGPCDAGNAQAVSSATNPVIASSQLGSKLHPDSLRAALSSTELAGRGAGRGGVSSVSRSARLVPGPSRRR